MASVSVMAGCSHLLARIGKMIPTPTRPFMELIKKADIIHPWTVGRYRDESSLQ